MLKSKSLRLGAALLATAACKPVTSSENASIAGEGVNSPMCKNESTWKSEVCGTNKSQVIVTKVLNIDSEFNKRLRQNGVQLCFGQIKWFGPLPFYQGKAWQEDLGVWLGSWGCHQGVGYKLVTSGATGENAVTPLFVSIDQPYAPPYDLLFPRLKETDKEVDLRSPIGRYDQKLVRLCTDEYSKKCEIGVKNNTLYIKRLSGN